ncbi:MAG: ABC transporter permease [Bacteroidales bacterium]|nr:ABC transporter permease [Bacteroidales bacterium]
MKLFKMKHIFTVPSLLNISGIAIAVAAFYVIMSVVDFDLTYNHSIKDYDKVYNLFSLGGTAGLVTSSAVPSARSLGSKCRRW